MHMFMQIYNGGTTHHQMRYKLLVDKQFWNVLGSVNLGNKETKQDSQEFQALTT